MDQAVLGAARPVLDEVPEELKWRIDRALFEPGGGSLYTAQRAGAALGGSDDDQVRQGAPTQRSGGGWPRPCERRRIGLRELTAKRSQAGRSEAGWSRVLVSAWMLTWLRTSSLDIGIDEAIGPPRYAGR